MKPLYEQVLPKQRQKYQQKCREPSRKGYASSRHYECYSSKEKQAIDIKVDSRPFTPIQTPPTPEKVIIFDQEVQDEAPTEQLEFDLESSTLNNIPEPEPQKSSVEIFRRLRDTLK